jgi:hypothetical protein
VAYAKWFGDRDKYRMSRSDNVTIHATSRDCRGVSFGNCMILHRSGLSRPKRTIYRGIDADAGIRGNFADELGEDAKVGTVATGGNVLRLCQVESVEVQIK